MTKQAPTKGIGGQKDNFCGYWLAGQHQCYHLQRLGLLPSFVLISMLNNLNKPHAVSLRLTFYSASSVRKVWDGCLEIIIIIYMKRTSEIVEG